MALHRITKTPEAKHRFREVRIVDVGNGCEIAFGLGFSSWPRLALRLQQRGHRVESALQKGRPVLGTTASAEDIKALQISRARRSRPRKFVVIAVVAVSIAFLLSFSLATKAQPVQQKILEKPNRCSEKALDRALTRDEIPSYMVQTQALKSGGVETGEISCEANTYSYTLDRGKTKRVLKLQKLDS